MKNLKKLLLGAVLGLLCATVAQAQTSIVFTTNLVGPLVGTNYLTNGQVILTNGGYYISEIDVSVGSSPNSNAIVTLYDCTNNTPLGATNAFIFTSTNAFQAIVKSEVNTNITSVLTNNSTGQVYTNVYPGTFTTFTTNNYGTNATLNGGWTNAALWTNAAQPIAIFSVPQNNVYRRTGQHISPVYGLGATCNTSNVTLTVFYSPNF